jgi:hypothetical protein
MFTKFFPSFLIFFNGRQYVRDIHSVIFFYVKGTGTIKREMHTQRKKIRLQ